MSSRLLAVLLVAISAGSLGAAQPVKVADVGAGEARRITVENDYYRMVLAPAQGGRIESFISRRTGMEVTRPGDRHRHGGLLTEGVWQQSYWHGDWQHSAYDARVVTRTPQEVVIELSATGRHWEDITIVKKVTARPDRSVVTVQYEMRGGPNAHD